LIFHRLFNGMTNVGMSERKYPKCDEKEQNVHCRKMILHFAKFIAFPLLWQVHAVDAQPNDACRLDDIWEIENVHKLMHLRSISVGFLE
jgi:hypothetical protein